MKAPNQQDPMPKWLTTLSWPDKIIAHCFPKFFKQYAPEEIQEQWAEYQSKKQRHQK